jgi:hypothetical protein
VRTRSARRSSRAESGVRERRVPVALGLAGLENARGQGLPVPTGGLAELPEPQRTEELGCDGAAAVEAMASSWTLSV